MWGLTGILNYTVFSSPVITQQELASPQPRGYVAIPLWRWEFPISVRCLLFQVFKQVLMWNISQKPLPQLCLCIVEAGLWFHWRSLMSNTCPSTDNLWSSIVQSSKFLCFRRKRCKITMAVRKQPIKTNNLKVRVAGSNVTNRCDDGKIDGVSWRNNLTLLELFTSNTWPGQHSARGGFYFTCLYLCTKLCHQSFPNSMASL